MTDDDIYKSILFRYELMLSASQGQVAQQQQQIEQLTAARDKLQEALDAAANTDASS